MQIVLDPETDKRGKLIALLEVWRAGDQEALTRLMPLVYDQLRRLAQRYVKHERAEDSLRATALVHETYLRLAETRRLRWRDQKHFFAVAALIMRRILVDQGRWRSRLRHGGGSVRVTLAPDLALVDSRTDDALALDQALSRLSVSNPRQARLVKLRFFTGLTLEETAEVLGVGTATAVRDWRQARAWLYRELQGGRAVGESSA